MLYVSTRECIDIEQSTRETSGGVSGRRGRSGRLPCRCVRSLGTSECGTRDLCNRKNVIKETGLLIEQQPYPSGLNARVSGELSSLGHRTERLRQKEGTRRGGRRLTFRAPSPTLPAVRSPRGGRSHSRRALSIVKGQSTRGLPSCCLENESEKKLSLLDHNLFLKQFSFLEL